MTRILPEAMSPLNNLNSMVDARVDANVDGRTNGGTTRSLYHAMPKAGVTKTNDSP